MLRRSGVLVWQPVVLLCIVVTVVIIVSRRHDGGRFWLGMALAAAGLPLWMVAQIQLGSSFSVRSQARRLVTTGLRTVVAILVAMNVVQVFRAKREAKVLEATFGGDYRRYRARTWF